MRYPVIALNDLGDGLWSVVIVSSSHSNFTDVFAKQSYSVLTTQKELEIAEDETMGHLYCQVLDGHTTKLQRRRRPEARGKEEDDAANLELKRGLKATSSK